MSEYINIHLKTPKGEFCEIGCFGRSSYIYQFMNTAKIPYGKVKKVDTSYFEKVMNDGESLIKEFEARIKKDEKELNFLNNVPYMGNIDTLLESYRDIETSIQMLKDDIETMRYALNQISFYNSLNEDYDYEIYVGIECGEPTEADILEN